MLVDTSVWIDHFRRGHTRLAHRLETAQVYTHPFVTGELCCGHLARRDEIMTLLQSLPTLQVIEHDEVVAFVNAQRLYGRGLGWVDMHLLASARLARVAIWTLDKRLAAVSADLGLTAN